MSTIAAQNKVKAEEEYVLGLEGTPFYTKRWFPADGQPKAYVVFCHGFAEHIERYDHFFRMVAAPPFNIHVFAFDKRGHGRTSRKPLDDQSPHVLAWRKEGKTVNIQKGMKGRNGGWAKAFPDMEFFIQREHERSAATGKKLYLWGHSQGGGEVLGFCVQKGTPPKKETIGLLSGVIASGPFIRSTKPLPYFQVKAGLLANSIGLGNMVITNPLDVKDLSRDPEQVEKCKNDPFCEPLGSIKTAADMINGGEFLDSRAAWDAWPVDLPLLLYHGAADSICDPKATVRFGDRVVAKDKTTRILDDLFHESHNELSPAPADVSEMVSNWILKHAGEDEVRSKL